MKVYFYHTQDIQHILGQMSEGRFSPHFLYGAARLPENGVEVVWHKSRLGLPRWLAMLRTAWRVLASRERFDAIYATHYTGLELVIMLRALRLYPHPIVVWHHQPVITPRQAWRERLGRVFYRGMDRMIFFSEKLVNDSLHSPKARPERIVLGHWGADIGFYDRLLRDAHGAASGFISTGKEMRDMPTLVNAFNRTGERLDIYIGGNIGGVNYSKVFSALRLEPNVRLHDPEGLGYFYLSERVAEAGCVVICCQESKYTVGLTTLVEALALGKPVICSRNPQFPIDVEESGCGISVPYYDVEGWERAIRYISSHPEEAREMGRRGRLLAERMYNDERCAREVAQLLKSVVKGR